MPQCSHTWEYPSCTFYCERDHGHGGAHANPRQRDYELGHEAGIREGEQRERARVVAELERRIDEHTASAVRHRDLGNTGWAQKDERSARTLEGMLKFVRGDHEGTKGGEKT